MARFLNPRKEDVRLLCTPFSVWASSSPYSCGSSRGCGTYHVSKEVCSSILEDVLHCIRDNEGSKGILLLLGLSSFLISCWEMDAHPGSGAASSLGRLTYAFCFYSGNRCRITGCEHLMQMECCGISLIFSVTQYDKLMLCFSHLVLMFRQKRAVVSVDFFKEVKQLIGKIINLVRI